MILETLHVSFLLIFLHFNFRSDRLITEKHFFSLLLASTECSFSLVPREIFSFHRSTARKNLILLIASFFKIFFKKLDESSTQHCSASLSQEGGELNYVVKISNHFKSNVLENQTRVEQDKIMQVKISELLLFLIKCVRSVCINNKKMYYKITDET